MSKQRSKPATNVTYVPTRTRFASSDEEQHSKPATNVHVPILFQTVSPGERELDGKFANMTSVNEKKEKHEQPDISGDRLNIFILSFMYILQGTMFGLMQAIPLILQNRKASYADQVQIITI